MGHYNVIRSNIGKLYLPLIPNIIPAWKKLVSDKHSSFLPAASMGKFFCIIILQKYYNIDCHLIIQWESVEYDWDAEQWQKPGNHPDTCQEICGQRKKNIFLAQFTLWHNKLVRLNIANIW